MSSLRDLDFTDLYVRLDARAPARYAPASNPQRGILTVPHEFDDEIDFLRATLRKQEHDDFSVDLEDMRLRASRQTVFGDETWVALRRVSLEIPRLDELSFKPNILQAFRSWGRRRGLIIVGGPTRAGKTTTAVALLNDFLRTHGRVAYTVEDPVEYLLQGPVGEAGQCFQIEIHDDGQWGDAIKKALRWSPKYIFIGELRTQQAARHLLRAATTGHTVICTVHGGTIEETLGAVLQLAEAELGAAACNQLADGLIAVMHQSLVRGEPVVNLLQTEAGNMADPIRAAIRANKLNTLGTYINQQAARRRGQAPGAPGGGAGQGGAGKAGDGAAKKHWPF